MLLRRPHEIDRFLEAPDKRIRAALIYGRQPGLVRERANTLAGKVTDRPHDPFDVVVLEANALPADFGRLEVELRAISMMGGRRLVRLRMSPGSAAQEEPVARTLVAHLEGEFNPDAFFLIEAGDLRQGALLNGASTSAQGVSIVCYDDELSDVATMVRQSLAKDGLTLSSEALSRFVASLPTDRMMMRQEIERLALFLGPGQPHAASEGDLEAFFGAEPDATLAAAANEAFAGRIGAAFDSLRRAEQAGERGAAAVRAMGLHLGRLRRAFVLKSAGAGAQQAAKAAGVFWKLENDFLRQLRAWTQPELQSAQADILVADQTCKQALAPDILIAERLTLTVASRARRLGL